MTIRPLSKKLHQKLVKLQLLEPYNKQVRLFEKNTRHPSLNYEVMAETKKLRPVIHSFRINQKYRVLGYEVGDEFQPINVTNHYK
jgi:hypothetical protein